MWLLITVLDPHKPRSQQKTSIIDKYHDHLPIAHRQSFCASHECLHQEFCNIEGEHPELTAMAAKFVLLFDILHNF